MKDIKNIVKKSLFIILSTAVLIICIFPFFETKASSGKVRLVVDLHGYTPSTSRIPTAEDPNVFNSTHYIAEAFMEENPDIEIVWARTKPVGGLNAEVAQWFTTQIAGGEVPAIAFSWGTAYQDRDWYLPLDDYLGDEWTYGGGFKTWRDVFRDYLWKSEAVVNARGEVVAIPVTVFPGAATGYFYNKAAFMKCGIEDVPVTWDQLIKDAEILKSNKYIGVAPWTFFNLATVFDAWVWGSVFSPSFAGYVMNHNGIDYDGNGVLGMAEQVRACLEGHFLSKHPYTKDMYYNMKKYYQNTLEPAWSSIEYYGDWLDGNVGIREEGIWAIPFENSTARDFDYGVFVAPLVSKDTSEYVDEVKYSSGPFEPGPDLVLNIMKQAVEGKPEVLDAALRFLKYLTKPENVSMICVENGGVLGAVKNTGHSNLIDEFIRQKFPKSTNASWPAGFTDEYKDKINRSFEKWVNGKISDEQFFSETDKNQIDGAKSFIRKMNINTEGWNIPEVGI